MMNKWHTLREREQSSLIAAGVLLVLYVLYFFIVSPLLTAVDTTQKQILEKKETLTWMQKINHLHHSAKAPKPLTNGQLLSLIAKQLGTPRYQGFPYQLQQSSGNDILLVIEKIPYALIMQWLYTLTQEYTVNLKQLTVDKTLTSGLVKFQITLTAT